MEDEVGEQVKKSAGGAKDCKMKLFNKTQVSHTLCEYGSNKAFVVHVISAMSYCDRKS